MNFLNSIVSLLLLVSLPVLSRTTQQNASASEEFAAISEEMSG